MGNLIAAVGEVLDFIQRHISMGVEIGAKAARDEKWDYPLEALREAVVNAIVHRDYTDPGNVQIQPHGLEGREIAEEKRRHREVLIAGDVSLPFDFFS